MIILEEGNIPHLRCPRCDVLVPWKALNGQHATTALCSKGVEQKICCLEAEDMRESTERCLQAYVRPLEMVTSFKYLGQVLAASDDDWTEVVGNLRKSRKS